MISQLSPFLDFRLPYIPYIHSQNEAYYAAHNLTPRQWSTGKIYNSSTGVQVLLGSKVRTPGRYRAPSSDHGGDSGRYLEDTHEYIHASVRFRMGLGGLGTEDKGPYQPHALNGWTSYGGADGKWKWVYGEKVGGKKLVLLEDELGEVELRLLRESPAAASYLAERG